MVSLLIIWTECRREADSIRRRIHCFENVQVLVFVAALSEYDQSLWEDSSVNRLDEATQLFESLASSRWFAKSSFVLLLNKLDLFKMKLVTSPLSNWQSGYTGGADLALATAFMARKFTDLYQRGPGVHRFVLSLLPPSRHLASPLPVSSQIEW